MKYKSAILTYIVLVAGGIPWSVGNVQAQTIDPQTFADQIGIEVAELRKLPFRKPITARNQSMDDFSRYLDAELERQIPEQRSRYFGKIVNKLGLYRGPEIEDMAALVKSLMTSQTGAYYDPASETFYVLLGQMDKMQAGTIYAHELYHGLQDQYWDLDNFLLAQTGGALNDDELMARQAVVEGEATYLMTMWAMKEMLSFTPEHSMIATALKVQAGMDVAMLQSMMSSEMLNGQVGDDVKAAMDQMDEIPAFMSETLLGAYLKGAAFVAEIINHGGWKKVEELYTRPPISSEQILYPEKWLSGENPNSLQWPDFESEAALSDWEVIDSNVIGELQWRIIFAEFDMKEEGIRASAGWDGDSYTVFKRRGQDDWLLFVYTSWDSEKDAAEFAGVYRSLLKIKYDTEQTRVVVDGMDVLIIEAPVSVNMDSMLSVMKKTSKTKQMNGTDYYQ